MDVIITISLILIVLSVWRLLNQHYAGVKFRVRLHNLKLETEKLIEKGIIKDNEFTQFLHGMIVDSISDYWRISMFFIMLRNTRNASNERNEEADAFLSNLESYAQQNKNFGTVYKKFSRILRLYLKEQHYITYLIFVNPAIKVVVSILRLSKWVANLVPAGLFTPKSANDERRIISALMH